MSYQPTSDDIKILRQREKKLGVYIELLNNNFQVIDTMSGALVNGSISISTSNSNRTSCELTFVVKNKSYLVNKSGKIWFDKYLRLYLTIEGQRDGLDHKYPIGLFMFYQNSFEYSAVTNTIQCSCHDLMDKLNGVRNGQLFGVPTTKILAGTNIRESIIGIISQLGNISKYIIGDVGSLTSSGIDAVSGQNYNSVPYDLSFSMSDTLYSMLDKLITLYPNWEMFFDDNVFVVQPIPTCENDPVVLDYETIEKKQLVISEERNNTFEGVKNVVEIWGKQITVDRYTETCTANGAEYDATFTDLTALETGGIYAVKLPSANLANATLKINSLTAYPITDTSEVALNAGSITGYSAFKFYNNKFMYLGQYQVHAVAFLVSALPSVEQQNAYKAKYNCDNIKFIINPDSPFTIEKIGVNSSDPYTSGVLYESKSGEGYQDIYSQDLAIQRAVYELKLASNFKDTCSLTLQLVPWLRANQKLSYRSQITGEIEQWIIKQIDITLLDGTMKLSLSKFYETDYTV